MSDLQVTEVSAPQAGQVCQIIHAGFADRPRLDPPSTALEETPGSVGAALAADGGLLCRVDGEPAGTLLFFDDGQSLALRRVSVLPRFQHRGVGTALVGVAEEVAQRRGYVAVVLTARAELPHTVEFWHRRGYAAVSRSGTTWRMGKALPVDMVAATAEDVRDLGARLASLVRSGDVVLLTGELGAGKTTLVQGLGTALKVRGDVTSPTFVISRMHPSLVDGPALVHVDAYRLGDAVELDDLDIDAYVDDAVTVVEWGSGVAEALSADRLHVHLARTRGVESVDETRLVTVSAVGGRWVGVPLRSVRLTPAENPSAGSDES